jgi:hypothetical protein
MSTYRGGPAELLPREGAVVPGRQQLVAEDGDSALATAVEVREGAPLRLAGRRRVYRDAELLELRACAPAELVAAEPRVPDPRGPDGDGLARRRRRKKAGASRRRPDRYHDRPHSGLDYRTPWRCVRSGRI